MSTLKVDKLYAGDRSTGSDENLLLNDDGTTNLKGATTVTGTCTATTFSGSGASLTNLPAANLTGTLPAISGASLTNLPASGANPNILHNPAFQIWQRGETLTGLEVDAYSADRWKQWGGAGGQAGRSTIERSTDVPADLNVEASMKISCTTAETPGASEGYMIIQRLEGKDVAHLKCGTSDAESVTVSFWVKGDASKTYSFNLFRSTGTGTNRVFTKTFPVTTSWVKQTITVTGDTSQAYDEIGGNGHQMQVGIALMQGTQSATNNAWQDYSSGKYAVSGSDNFFESTDRRLYLAGMKMEIGTSATDFHQPDYSSELRRCERYLEYVVEGNAQPICTAAGFAGDMVTGVIQFRTPKRTATPSMVKVTGTDYLRFRYTYYNNGANNTQDGDDFNLQYKSYYGAGLWFTSFDFGDNNRMGAGGLLYSNNTAARLAFSSEL